ncbi:MAG: YetF domain-containing protein [Pseudomonadota bacterium]
MWEMSVPWWEFVLRGVLVYVFLLVFLRITGKRQTGQYAPFDLVLLLILSNAVQNSMNAGDNSLVGGLISASTLMGCHVVLANLTFRFAWLERLIDGTPRVLVDDGKVHTELMHKELLSTDDLEAALRASGCLHLHEVERATIETNGQITVVLRKRGSAG